MRPLALLSTLALFTFTASLSAKVIYVDATPSTAGNDGTSWANAYPDLQDALADANSGDQIWVAEGTYKPTSGTDRSATFSLIVGVDLYGGFQGISNETSLDDRDSSIYIATLSGDIGIAADISDNSYHILTAYGANSEVVGSLDGFTITAGNANGTDFGQDNGGGLYNDYASPSVINCIFTANTAGNGGGAVYNTYSNATLTDCTFTGNSAGNGGAIANSQRSEGGSSVTISNCLFSANSAAGGNFGTGFGGAIHSQAAASVMVTGCDFTGNSSLYSGAALYSIETQLDLLDSTMTNNTGSSIVENYLGHSAITNCIFSANTGSAIGIDNTSPTISHCTFTANSSYQGGAIYSTHTSALISYCLFTGNYASHQGGAIASMMGAGPNFINCTFSGNSADTTGGAIYFDQGGVGSYTLSLTFCIVWNNAAAGVTTSKSASVGQGNGTMYTSASLIQNIDTYIEYGYDSPLDGTDASSDPLFINPAAPSSAPSTAGDYRLGLGSPAIGIQGFNTQGSLITDDLGFYPGAYATFATLYPTLNTDGDANSNGISNYLEYAMGATPTAAHAPNLSPTFSLAASTYTRHTRTSTADTYLTFQKSSNLSNWHEMVQGVDYTIESSSTSGDQITTVLNILVTPSPGDPIFFRDAFSATE